MEHNEDYISINRHLWNEKTVHHFKSDFYDVTSFLAGRNSIPGVDRALLGDVSGKKVLHLQCHFGQDTLSLARMGAKVTGVDLSDKAIAQAQNLNDEMGLDVRFICADVYETPNVLNEEFDIVYTSYGVLGWLPDMPKWANVISKMLKKGGELILVEFHPVVWMFDYDFNEVAYSYFNTQAIVEELDGTYAEKDAALKNKSVSWNHDLAEVLNSIIGAGLQISRFEEHDYSPWNCFNNTVETAEGKFMIKGKERKLPMMYAVKAIKT